MLEFDSDYEAAFPIRRDALLRVPPSNLIKATGIKLGLLINFGRAKVEYRRLIY